ncbi:hypothetical protein ABEB36_008002 [Hypothenemus hampei]|uniref:BTB domain-containing protein n=1 Tax=Hypothenemus hampei TaxID=57062 RepID=A0ABD1EKW5_HYPHA
MNSSPLSDSLQQEKLRTFFREQKFVDCTFKIGNEEIKAHKLILACSSPVFEKMFFGQLASNEIVLEDVEVLEFNQMLQFIYTETVRFSSITNAWSLFYLARKYILENLMDVCVGYISQNLTMSTLVLSYEYSELYALDSMREQCFRDIISHVNGIFVSDYHMKPSTLTNILKESLMMTKLDLVCKIIDWAVIECEYKNLPLIPENVVEILKSEDILKYINKKWLFDIACEYCNEVLIMCSCQDEFIHKIILFLSSQVIWDQTPQMEHISKFVPFSCKLRKVYKISQRLDLLHSDEFVSSVSVNMDLIVSGLSICTEMNCSLNPIENYKGCVVIRFCEQDSHKNVIKPTIMNDIFTYNSQVFIPLRYAITLIPGKIYDIRISYKNFYSDRPSSIVCSYMSDELVDKKRGYSKIYFYDFYGTIIKGVAYYPV